MADANPTKVTERVEERMRDYPHLPVIERVGHFGGAEVRQAMEQNRALITDDDGEWFVLHWRETYWGRGEATLRLAIPVGGLTASTLSRLDRLYGVR